MIPKSGIQFPEDFEGIYVQGRIQMKLQIPQYIFGNLVSSNPQLAIQEEETHAYENLVDLIGSTVAHVIARFD